MDNAIGYSNKISERKKIITIDYPRYLPSMDYLRRINESDVFVILDNICKYNKGYQNRNFIPIYKDGDHKILFTIPITGSVFKNNCQLEVADIREVLLHKNSIKKIFSSCKGYDEEIVDEYYSSITSIYKTFLISSLYKVVKILGIKTEIVLSSSLIPEDMARAVLIKNLCYMLRATDLLLGSSQRELRLVKTSFKDIGCTILFDKSSYYDPEETFLERIFTLGLEFVKKELLTVKQKYIL